jgi:predicted transcriptional regulator
VRLSRRERQIMDVIVRRGTASVSEVLEALPDPPSYSAVRATLRILEEKGQLRHRKAGARYIYEPVEAPARLQRSILKQIIEGMFGGSTEDAFAALLDASRAELDDDQLRHLAGLIDDARRKGR